MSLEENKSLIRRYFAAMSNGEVSALDTFIDAIHLDHSTPETPPGPDSAKQFLTTVRTAFPDAQWTVEDLIAEGDKIVARVVFRGTHQGSFLGIAPTGRQVAMQAVGVMRIANGKLAESWILRDRHSLLQQLGALPSAK